MKNKFLILSILFSAMFACSNVWGQCRVENTFFREGEVLTYDMYFKLGFTSTKAGELTLSVSNDKIEDKGHYKMTYQVNTSGIVNSIFALHDTLYAYTSKELVPIAYIKNASEGGDYTQERIFYSYPGNGKVDLRAKRHKNGEFKFDENLTTDQCIYDLVSVVYYARTFDFDSKKKGDVSSIGFISGKNISSADIEFKGKKKIKGNDKKHYECYELVLNFMAGGGDAKAKEMMKVYISADANRIPIQIDSNLKKVGSVKGVIKATKGLRN